MNYIINPKNKKKYKLSSIKGLKILKKYIYTSIRGGNIENIVRENINRAEKALSDWSIYLKELLKIKNLSQSTIDRIKKNIGDLECKQFVSDSSSSNSPIMNKDELKNYNNYFQNMIRIRMD